MISNLTKYKYILIFYAINILLLMLIAIVNTEFSCLLFIIPAINGGLQLLQAKLFKLQIVKEYDSIKNFELCCLANKVRIFPDYKHFFILGYTPFIWGIYFGKIKLSQELNYMKKRLIIPVLMLPFEFCLLIVSFVKLLF